MLDLVGCGVPGFGVWCGVPGRSTAELTLHADVAGDVLESHVTRAVVDGQIAVHITDRHISAAVRHLGRPDIVDGQVARSIFDYQRNGVGNDGVEVEFGAAEHLVIGSDGFGANARAAAGEHQFRVAEVAARCACGAVELAKQRCQTFALSALVIY